MKFKIMADLAAAGLMVLAALIGCSSNLGESAKFINIGEFSIKTAPGGIKEIRDGAGRTLVLVPRGQTPPQGYAAHQIIEIPVRRVVAYSGYDISLLNALGVLPQVLVGVTKEKDYWVIPEIVSGMEQGRITYVGESQAVDFEELKNTQPEVVFTWDQAAIPILAELEIPAVITTAPVAMDLDTRLQFARFLAVFFDRGKEADAFVKRVYQSVERVQQKTEGVTERPVVAWGDIYNKRVKVEPGNSWAAEIILSAGGQYAFDDVYGAA